MYIGWKCKSKRTSRVTRCWTNLWKICAAPQKKLSCHIFFSFFHKESLPAFQPHPVHVIRYALARIITNLHIKCATLILLGGSGGQPRAGNTRRRCLRCARTRIDRLYDAIASYVYLCGARARAHVRMHHRDETPLTPICLPSSRMIQLQATTSTSCTTSSYTQSFAYAQPRDHISA